MATTYRADQVGSFLRPPEVLQAHQAHAEGSIPLEELRRIEDRAILAVLDLQQQVGVDVLTDGEYRRGSWSGDFADAVDGYVQGAPPVTMHWHRQDSGEATTAPQGVNTAPLSRVIGNTIKQRRRLTEHELVFLKEHARGPIKVTMPAASYIVARGYKPGLTDKVYESRAAVLRDVAAIIRSEIEWLIAEGVPYVQLDNPHYPDYVVEERRQQYRTMGLDPDQTLREDIEADNTCLHGLDRGRVTLAMHLCRGNGGRAGWHTQGGYERIAEQVFGSIDVDRFLLEYDSERAGGFEPLRFMPSGKTVVLGLVTTKAGDLEPQELLRRRIDEAAKYMPLENLALSPQCGFASVMEGNPLTWDDQRRKLELVVETARKIWD